MNKGRSHRIEQDLSSKLEAESKRMEDRLSMLKTMLSAEKSKRNVEGGIRWRSVAPPVKKKVTSVRPVKVRILKDQVVEKNSLSLCGQCDKGKASLHCVECRENYCNVCFVKMHQKGVLSQHRVRPFTKPTASSAVNTGVTHTQTHDEVSASLLDGEYNEQASAASFQQALADWRAGSSQEPTGVSTGTSTTSVKLAQDNGPPCVSFSEGNGVSYLEKLMTRRSRYDPSLLKKMTPLPGVTTEDQSAVCEEAPLLVSSEPSQYNIFYDSDEFGSCNEETHPLFSSVPTEPVASPPTQAKPGLKPKSREISMNSKATPKALSLASELSFSVQQCWSQCSQGNKTPELSNFFLNSVECETTPPIDPTNSPTTSSDSANFTGVWLQSNSVSHHGDRTICQGDPSSCHSDSDSEPIDFELSMCEADECCGEDKEALESLAWELASTIHSQSRLSHCEDEEDSYVYHEPTDLHSQFELLHQQLLEEEL